jgi:hypothetical protein
LQPDGVVSPSDEHEGARSLLGRDGRRRDRKLTDSLPRRQYDPRDHPYGKSRHEGVRVRLLSLLAMVIAVIAAAVTPHGTAAAATTSTPSWSSVAGAEAPPSDGVPPLPVAYDNATGQFLAYDADPACGNSPMWLWDGRRWSHLAAPGPLPGLIDPVTAYDDASRQLLMFGGYQSPCSGGARGQYVAQTWSWNGAAWKPLKPAVSPPAGGGGCAAYDPVRKQVVMYLVFRPDEPDAQSHSETWTWDGTTWTARSVSPEPTAFSSDCGMSFDAATGTVALVTNGGGDHIDTWAWDGSAWAQRPASGPEPIVGDSLILAAGPAAGQVFLYAGVEPCPISGVGFGDCLQPVSQLWQLQNGTWSLVSTDVAPPSRVDGAFGYDAGTNQLVLSGGSSDGSWLSDTWVYAPSGGSGTTVRRLGGTDREGTAVAVSQASFPAAGSAASAVICREDQFSDALVGAPLAAAKNGPLLLTSSSNLDQATRDELTRVLPAHGTVYLLGGVNALSAVVATQVADLGYKVVRIAGADRYATAVAVASALGNPSTVFEASGQTFADALSAAPAAASQHGVVLLTAGATQSNATAAYLTAHAAVRYAVGGAAAKADPDAVAVFGSDRYATSAAVARAFFAQASSFAVATGANFPDALAGGAYSAAHSQPLLLVPSTTDVPEPVEAYVATHAPAMTGADVLGGRAAVSDDVVEKLDTALAGG